MPIDTSNFAFPKPTRANKKGKKVNKAKKVDMSGMYESEVSQMVDFYESHRGDMVSVENKRYTKKLQHEAARWIRDILESQHCEIGDVISAWEQTIVYTAEKVHSSHRKSFINFLWIIKNDLNYLEILEGKYDKPFNNKSQTAGWGNEKDFAGVENNGPSGIVV